MVTGNERMRANKVAMVLGVSVYQVWRSRTTGYLGVLKAPPCVVINQRYWFTKSDIDDYKRRVIDFDKHWISAKALRSRLGLTESNFIKGIYETGKFHEIEVPIRKIFPNRRMFFLTSDVQRWEREFNEMFDSRLAKQSEALFSQPHRA